MTEDPRPSSPARRPVGWSIALAAAVLVSLLAGVVAGVLLHEPIRVTLGLDPAHDAEGAATAGEAAGETSGEKKQLWTCGMHPQVIRDGPGTCPICHMALEPMKVDEAEPGGETGAGPEAVTIDPVIVQNMGVRTGQVTRGPLRREVRAVGLIEQPQPGLHDINLRVGGWIEKLYAHTEGMTIEKGQPLFDLYSPEVLVGVEELISARRSLAQLAPGASPTLRRSAQITYDAAVRKLELWGLGEEQVLELSRLDHPPATITFNSPVTAEVSERMVVEGAAVMAGERVLRLADRSVVWLDAQVFTQDLPFIQVGQAVTATVESFPGKEFSGKVVFIHPRVEAATRTALARIELDNPELLLRPGMYATVHSSAELADHATLVPDQAVIDTGTRQVVFVALGGGRFEPRSVRTGLAGANGRVQVLEGLAPGETVVTSGQFLLDSESRMREAVQKYLSQSSPAGDSEGPALPGHQH